MVDIAGAASGPFTASGPNPLLAESQTSQVATENVAPEQASGVTAPGNIDANGQGGSQGSFDNPASGENLFQAQTAGSDRPLTPIEEAIRDFPPDAVVQQQQALDDAINPVAGFDPDAPVNPDSGEAASVEPDVAAVAEQATANTGQAPPAEGNDFGVTEEQAGQQAQAAAPEAQDPRPVSEEGGQTEAPDTNLTGANDNPFALANGSAGDAPSGGQAATQPPGSVVDFAA
jgi:hypothetical protein